MRFCAAITALHYSLTRWIVETLEILLAEGLDRYACRVHAFCWMSNHIHLAVEVAQRPLGQLIQFVASRFARQINRRYSRRGHLFERRHRAILVTDDAQLVALVRYIHRNPVEAGMVVDAAKYRWSSHRAYLGQEAVPWLTCELTLRLFAKSLPAARNQYASFMERRLAAELEDTLETERQPIAG